MEIMPGLNCWWHKLLELYRCLLFFSPSNSSLDRSLAWAESCKQDHMVSLLNAQLVSKQGFVAGVPVSTTLLQFPLLINKPWCATQNPVPWGQPVNDSGPWKIICVHQIIAEKIQRKSSKQFFKGLFLT